MTLKEIRTLLERSKGKKAQIENDLATIRRDTVSNVRELHLYEKAKEVLNEVSSKTQQQLSFHISDVTSMAEEAVFDDPYELVMDFIQRRDKTECDILFKRGEELIKPLDASGFGTVDIASFALRIAAWSMNTPRTRNTIILDEPFGWLSNDMQERASEMIKEIADKLQIQFIIITHDSSLSSYADRIFEVKLEKREVNGKEYKVSKVIAS